MSEVVTDFRLAEAHGRVERLEEDAQGTAEENARIRRHLDAVRAAQASAVAAAREAGDRFESALEDLATKLAIARHRLTAEITHDRDRFEWAVEQELQDWATYLSRLERRSEKEGSTGGPSREAIVELRSRYEAVESRLGELRVATGEAWSERRELVEAALDELEQAADARTSTSEDSSRGDGR
jgi:predicted  nucleic acid-binding Zn-ribbon protein